MVAEPVIEPALTGPGPAVAPENWRRPTTERTPITELSLAGLTQLALELGEPRYRGAQMAGWLYRTSARSFEEMTNLPQALRERLVRSYDYSSLRPVAEVISADGHTRKALFQLPDGETIESVLMRFDPRSDGSGGHRTTVCVSTQVGCPVKCSFCATGLMGFGRNLSAGEIVDQVLHFLRWSRSHPPVVRNVVFMGMGEPMLNYDATLEAVRRLADPEGCGLAARHLTISTVGFAPGIVRLASEPYRVRLAVSLHAPNDAVRGQLVPMNRRYPVAEVLAACHEYQRATGDRITFEYTLIEGVNDSPALARELVERVRGLDCHVNLIPLNPVDELPGRPSTPEVVDAFHDLLRTAGLICTVRREMGRDIKAACGQLRTEVAPKKPPAFG